MRLPVLITIGIVLAGCGGMWLFQHPLPAQPLAAVKQSPPDSRLDGVITAAADLRASVAVGLNIRAYQSKLQRFSAELLLAREKGTDVSKYDTALQAYKDALGVWQWELESCSPAHLLERGMYEICADGVRMFSRNVGISHPNLNPYNLNPAFEAVIRRTWEKAEDSLAPSAGTQTVR